jgi:hypothetical protein
MSLGSARKQTETIRHLGVPPNRLSLSAIGRP